MSELQDLVYGLEKHPDTREAADNSTIIAYLRNLECLREYNDSNIETVAYYARLSQHESSEAIFEIGDSATCWYIVLSGSVCVDDKIYVPNSCFGKADSCSNSRSARCVAMEPCSLICITYFEQQLQGDIDGQLTLTRTRCQDVSTYPVTSSDSTSPEGYAELGGAESVNSVSELSYRFSACFCNADGDVDETIDSLQGGLTLLEADIISDDVDADDTAQTVSISESQPSFSMSRTSSALQTLFQRPANERTAEDIEVLLAFCSSLAAFKPFSTDARRALCRAALFHSIEQRDAIVHHDGERLEFWSVLVSGCVSRRPIDSGADSDLQVRTIDVGDPIGIDASQYEALVTQAEVEELRNVGELRTEVDDCELLRVPLADFIRVLHEERAKTVEVRDDAGRVVLIREAQTLASGDGPTPSVVIKGTPERLLDCLLEDHSVSDSTFVEDLILTWRLFLPSITPLTSRLTDWYEHTTLRDRVVRIVLFWVNAQFDDFETLPQLASFLERFETRLARDGLFGQLALLHLACAAKASRRCVSLHRNDVNEPLPLCVVGGLGLHAPVFIARVTYPECDGSNSKQQLPLLRGDQVLAVDDVSFENVLLDRAQQILRSSLTPSLTVKSNPIAFYELINSTRFRQRHADLLDSLDLPLLGQTARSTTSASGSAGNSPNSKPLASLPVTTAGDGESRERRRASSLFGISKLRRAASSATSPWKKFSSTVEQPTISTPPDAETSSSRRGPSELHAYYKCVAVALAATNDVAPDEHVIQVHRTADSSRLIALSRSTTAHEVVMLALQAFGLSDASTGYSLCEVSVERATDASASAQSKLASTVVRQKRLADSTNELAFRLGLNARYFLKPHAQTDTLIPDGHQLVDEMLADAKIGLLVLDAFEVARRIAEVNYELFRAVRPFEYITKVFLHRVPHVESCDNLQRFAAASDELLFWVCSEVLTAGSVMQRVRTLKQLIRVACWLRRFGDLFGCQALLAGLSHTSVARLSQSWSLVPRKYSRALTALERYRDPSRNFKVYRTELQRARSNNRPCVIWLPIHLSDLTKIKEVCCQSTCSSADRLVDFASLRLVAREVRAIRANCAVSSLQFPQRPSAASSSCVDFDSDVDVCNRPEPHNGTLKRSNSSVASLSGSSRTRYWKRQFEALRETRRVRAYMDARHVCTDETKLLELSYAAELQRTTTSASPAVANSDASNVATNGAQRASMVSSSGNSSAASSFAGSLQSVSASVEKDLVAASVLSRFGSKLRRTLSNPPPPDDQSPLEGQAEALEETPQQQQQQTPMPATVEPRTAQRVNLRHSVALSETQNPLAAFALARRLCPLQSPIRLHATAIGDSGRSSVCSVQSAVVVTSDVDDAQQRRSSMPDCSALLGSRSSNLNISCTPQPLSVATDSPRTGLTTSNSRWPRIPKSNSTLVEKAARQRLSASIVYPLSSVSAQVEPSEDKDVRTESDDVSGHVIAV